MELRKLIVTGIYEYSNVGLTQKKSVISDDLRLNLKKTLLKEHKNFLFEELSLLIEKELTIGAALKKKLDSINKPFADKLLKYLTSNEIPDRVSIDTIDYTKDDDKTLTGFFKDKDGKVKTQKFKIGKLLDYLGISVNEFKGYEIQELVSYLKKGTTKDFKIVDGKDILWAYHCDNYDEGETMGSCMRYDKAQKFLEIYTENPNEIKCLVLLNPNNNKVRGRALLFNMDNGQILMDRVYVINDEYRHLFNQYSDENNYTRRASSTVTLSNGGDYEYYPYMDTLMYYNPEDGILSETVIGDGYVKLQDTDGDSQPAGTYIDLGSREGEYVDEDYAGYIDYVYDRMRYEGYAHIDDLIILDGAAYLSEHVVELVNGESAFIGDDEIYYIERGVNSGKYGREGDVVSLNDYHYDGDMATWEDVVKCDGDLYGDTGVFFMEEDTVKTYNGKVVFKDDVVRLYPEHYGEGSVAHVDDTTEVKIKDFGHAYILSDDVDEFENKGLLEIKSIELRESISVILRQALNEVKYLTPNKYGEPKRDNSPSTSIRVYHGIDRIGTIEKILKKGLSGSQKIKRINSNETASDNGLFVTIDFDLAKRYASSGNIIEFTTSINDLIPVKDGASGTYNYKTAYDNLLSPTKSEALYIGDLNPNMIKSVWTYDSETRNWTKYDRKKFINNYSVDTKRRFLDIFLPNDDFDMDKIIKMYRGRTESVDFKNFVNKLQTADMNELSKTVFLYPKQIKQIIKLRNEDFFRKYL